MSKAVQDIIAQIEQLPGSDREALQDYLAHQAEAISRAPAKVETSPNRRDPEAWSKALHEWAASHTKRHIEIDDNRESIYEGCGE